MPFAAPRVLALLVLALPLAAQAPPTDLRAVAARPDVWPREVKLTAPATAGRTTLPAGQALKVVGLEGSSIVLDYQGALVTVPVAQTNFLALATPELARRPAPARPTVPPSAAPPPGLGLPLPAAPPAVTVNNELGAKLDTLLVRLEGESLARLPLGSAGLAKRRHLLLQFGGGPKWSGPMSEVAATVQNARAAGIDFDVVHVPLIESTVEDAVRVAKANSITWVMVDPREQSYVRQLWNQYGHIGQFTLAIVDAQGKTVIKTEQRANGSAGNFHTTLGELTKLPPAGGRP